MKDADKENVDIKSIETRITYARWVMFVLTVCGVIPFTYGIYSYCSSHFVELNEIGAFIGGTTGPLWSLAALSAIYLGFLIQRRDIELQKETFERRQFEEGFFRMLDVYEDIRQKLYISVQPDKTKHAYIIIEKNIEDESFRYKTKKHLGHENFEIGTGTYGEKKEVDSKETRGSEIKASIIRSKNNLTEREQEKSAKKAIRETMKSYGHDIKAYLDIVKIILNHLEESDTKRYVSIFKSKINESEKRLLYWFYMTNKDRELKRLVEHFEIVDDIERPEDFDFIISHRPSN